jgi:hypothetical protein
VTGKKELSQPPVVKVLFRVAPDADNQTVVRLLYGEPGRFVEQMIFCPQIIALLYLCHVGIGEAECVQAGVKKIRMAGVDAALYGLQVIGFL